MWGCVASSFAFGGLGLGGRSGLGRLGVVVLETLYLRLWCVVVAGFSCVES